MFCLRAVGGPYRANVFSWSGLATNRLARWATNPSAHTCRTSPVMRGLRPLQGQRIFSWAADGYQYIGPLGHNPFGPSGRTYTHRGQHIGTKSFVH
jgi:hypothetical protein